MLSSETAEQLQLALETSEIAAAAMTSGREHFSPNAANGALYKQMLDSVYPTIRDTTDPLFERVYPIFH